MTDSTNTQGVEVSMASRDHDPGIGSSCAATFELSGLSAAFDLEDCFAARAEAAGHTLIRDEDGEVDNFAYSPDGHNGPGCSVCGWSACHQCDGPISSCDGGTRKAESERQRRIRDAAPDLLEALKALLRATDFDDNEPWIVEAHAAIAKAEGRS